MNKREFLKSAAAMGVSLVTSSYLHSDSAPLPKTYTYKTVDTCELKLDVYGSDAKVKKPAIVWIHGGALIFGSRAEPPQWLDPQGQYVVISIDYRLAPKTKLPEIIEDLQDAFQWLRERGPELLRIDSDRIAVTGQSAGGYLTLMSGFCVTPRPRVLLSLSGYGDITMPWYTQPSSFYLQEPLVSKEEAYRGIPTSCASTLGEEDKHRARFYLYCRQKGIWPKEVTEHDPALEPRWFDRYCPARNVSADYPPTILIHGDADTDVPFEESVSMDEKLSRFKIKHDFVQVPGGSHCLWKDPPDVKAAAFKKGMDFVRTQLS